MITYVRPLGARVLAGGVAAIVIFGLPPFNAARKSASNAVAVLTTPPEEGPILFYRDPMGGRDLSRKPRMDAMGMDYAPVRRSEVAPLLSTLPTPPTAALQGLGQTEAGK